MKAVSDLEPTIKSQIDKLSTRVTKFAESREVLPIGVAYSAMTMDIITEYATGSSYGNLDCKDFNQALVYCFAGFGPVWRVAKHIPWLLPLFMTFPSWMMVILSEKTAQYKALQEVLAFLFLTLLSLVVCFLFILKKCMMLLNVQSDLKPELCWPVQPLGA